jgi:hypothetical protein
MNPASAVRAAPAARQLFARRRWNCVRRYLGLDPDAWFRVVAQESDGIWIEGPAIGDPFLSPDRRFVFREDFDLREEGAP